MFLQYSAVFILIYFPWMLHGQEQVNNQNVDASVQICNMCNCSEIYREGVSRLQIYCGSLMTDLKDFNLLVWPSNKNHSKIDVTFESHLWTTIDKLPGNNYVESLHFLNNEVRSIRPGAFADLPYLKLLKISQSELSSITPDIFKNMKNLLELNLSDNKLSDFNPLDFEELKNLQSLKLANNLIEKIPVEALQKLEKLTQLDLSGNHIIFLSLKSSHGENMWIQNLKYFDLSSNKLSAIYLKDTFEKATSLEYLNLSSNAIVAIETDVFQNCTSLKVLDLANNALNSLPELVQSIEVLYLQWNAFKKWPTIPVNIKFLDLSKNNLYENYDEYIISFDQLEFLNISGNSLTDFTVDRPLFKIKYLDLSYNSLSNVPQSLNVVKLPELQELYLDGNPIEKLSFSSQIELNKLSAKHMKYLTSLDASSFSDVSPRDPVGTNLEFEEGTGCLDLMISHCENFYQISEDTFQGIRLCHLDISFNNLTSLYENTAEWSDLKAGVNLQGNPWNCGCNLQWMLDIILPDLYKNHPTYLHEWRCASPRHLQGIRFVHWYSRKEKAFCSKPMARYTSLQSTEDESNINVLMSGSGAVIGISVAIVAGLILCIILIVYLVMSKYKHSKAVRMQMMKKRQQMTDAKKLNRTNDRQTEPLRV